MRDINLISRDLFGNITFGFKSISTTINSNFEILLQKIETLILSNSKTTYFSTINGGDVTQIGKFNFDATGNGDFRAVFSSNLLLIKKNIQSDELINNIPINDRLKTLSLKDLLFDTKNGSVVLSLYVSTNNSNTIFSLPVK